MNLCIISHIQYIMLMRYPLVLILLFAAFGQEVPKLVLIQQVFRHGARYMDSILYPDLNDIFAKKQMSLGQLTTQGRHMHYLLGKKMYEKYWKQLFGGTPYETRYNQSKFYVRSTDLHRTVESAQSHLYGLLESLPPLTISQKQAQFSSPPYHGVEAKAGYVFGQKNKFYHSMPVHLEISVMTPTYQGDSLTTILGSDCPNQDNWISANLKNRTAIEMLNYPVFLDAVRKLQSSLNLPNGTINSNNFFNYYDNLKCMKFLGKDVPSLVVEPSATKRALDSYTSLVMDTKYFFNEEQRRASSTAAFAQTLSNIKRYIANDTEPQWIIYSAHDISIVLFLSAMKLWSAECIFQNFKKNLTDTPTCITDFPTYATIMVFEVYKYQNKSFTFKINYNGMYLQIPFCNHSEECSVDTLDKWFQSWRVSDVKLACGVFHKYKRQITSSLTGTVLTMIVLILIHFVIPQQIKRKIFKKIFGSNSERNQKRNV